MREEFGKTKLSNDKELTGRVSKMGEAKKAMPFVQGLKKRLVIGGEEPKTVFERKLAFEEVETLREMVPGLRRTTGCRTVEVVVVEEGGKTGKVVVGEDGGDSGEKRQALSPTAEAAVPGNPSFHFENIE